MSFGDSIMKLHFSCDSCRMFRTAYSEKNVMAYGIESRINELWENAALLDISLINDVMHGLDSGNYRIADKIGDRWMINEYLKKAILLYFKYNKSRLMSPCFFDKVPLKMENWTEADFIKSGFRAVPGAIVRYSAYIAQSVVLMPCFVNVGAYIDENTMIDSHALVGSCAQIGKNCHISDGVTIGGVLEPIQANPVIVEDNCFIGAKCVVTEGVIIGEGSVIATGTLLSASTKIIDRESGEVSYGYIPPCSVIVSGTYQTKNNLGISCAIIVKKALQQTREKTAINELLRSL